MAHSTIVKLVEDLVQIQDSRQEAYHQAMLIFGHSNPDLKAIFGEIIRQSLEFRQELVDSIALLNGQLSHNGTKHPGGLFSIWEDTSGHLGGGDHKAILVSCEEEMTAMVRAYESSLRALETTNTAIKQIIENQLNSVRHLLDELENYVKAL